MTRDKAIRYAKRLVKRVFREMENNIDTQCMMSAINDPNDDCNELSEKQLDVWAEYVFPDDEDDEKEDE